MRLRLLALAVTSFAAVARSFAQDSAPAEAAPSAAKYEEIAVGDGGSITGRVSFKGDPPALKLTINQDMAHCTHDATNERPSHRLRLDPGGLGGVGGAVVYIREIAKGKPLAALKCDKTLDQKDCAFYPFTQIVPFKERLKIVNSDPLNHNIHGKIGQRDIFNNAMPNTGWPKKDELDKAMQRPGIVSLQCDVHAWMSAYVFVVKHPYYAVTGEDGTYELADVPAGEYEVVAWHPAWEFTVNRDTAGKATGYTFGDPIEKKAKVKVEAKRAASADFVINE